MFSVSRITVREALKKSGICPDDEQVRTYSRINDSLWKMLERGEYFSGEEELKKTIENVCFNNVNEFFGFNVKV